MSEKLRQRYGRLLVSGCLGDTICIGDSIVLTIHDIDGDDVLLGINAPREIAIEPWERRWRE
jgi:carbon storage regulator CsrA